MSTLLISTSYRLSDAARAGVCHSQELLLRPHTTDRRGHAEGGQDAEIMGLEHWETCPEVPLNDNNDQHE